MKNQTVGEYRQDVEAATTQEVKTDDDARRVMLAGKMEAQLWELEEEALKYGYSGDMNNVTVPSLIRFVEVRKEQEKAAAAETAVAGHDTDEDKSYSLQTKPAGRRPDQEYDLAYEKLQNGETEKVVFKWYCDQRGITNPDRNDRKNFKGAMKYRDRK